MGKCNVQHSCILPWKFPRALETPVQAARLAAMETDSAGNRAVSFKLKAVTQKASISFCQLKTALCSQGL